MSAEMATLDERMARRARRVAVVIAATICVWMAAQWLGGMMGLPPRLAFLFDLAAIAALAWSLLAAFRLRRMRRSGSPDDIKE